MPATSAPRAFEARKILRCESVDDVARLGTAGTVAQRKRLRERASGDRYGLRAHRTPSQESPRRNSPSRTAVRRKGGATTKLEPRIARLACCDRLAQLSHGICE